MTNNIDMETKNKIISIVQALFPEAKIYLYGSRARGTHAKLSDIDIAINTNKKIPIEEIGELKSMLAASNILYKIDIVDYNRISDEMKISIDEEKIIWKD